MPRGRFGAAMGQLFKGGLVTPALLDDPAAPVGITGAAAMLAGYGSIDRYCAKSPRKLFEANVTVRDCYELPEAFWLCGTSASSATGCGDSGGPLLVGNVLVGLVSWLCKSVSKHY